MRQSSKDRAFAALIQAYRVVVGCSLRSAQRHAAANHPDWQRFVQGQAVQVVTATPDAAPSPNTITALASLSPVAPPQESAGLRDLSELSEPERILRATADMWHWHFSAWKSCLGGGTDPVTKEAILRNDGLALSHALACTKLREAYEKALVKFTQWEIDQRRLIPVNEFAALRSEFIIPLANQLEGMDEELAVIVNPQDPGFARSRIADWKQSRLKPTITRFINALDGTAPPAPIAA